jgi:hypothetical protein
MSTIAVPQLEGNTSATSYPKLFKECFSATAYTRNQNRNDNPVALSLLDSTVFM